MPLSLSPATENDLPGICEVHYHAFTDPFSLTLHPRTSYASHVEAYSNHLRRSMQNPSQYILKVVDDLSGRIVSFAKWSVACLKEELQKEEAEKREKEEQANNGNEEPSKPPQVLAEEGHGADGVAAPHRNKVVNMEFGNAFKKKITDIQMRHVGDRRTLFLEVLCTLPEARGRGAAKMHLKWGEDLARKGGMPIWLDASPVGLGLYEKEGFTFVEEVVTDLTEWGGEGSCVHTCMIKECVKVGEEGRDG